MMSESISHYELVEKIGEGGMGEVWKAIDTKLDREVAIKLLPASVANDPRRLARFKREAKTAAAINHPNIVTIHTVDEIDGVPFIVMELVHGTTLSTNIPHGGLPLKKLLGLAIPIADGLSESHRHNIIHRDLKPANIMVTDDGRAKIVDFGLALLRDRPSANNAKNTLVDTLTADGHVVGTVPYSSPEQLRGAEVDNRTDVFSFGSILYEMATGRRAFQGDNMADVLAAVLLEDPEPVTSLNSRIPTQLERIVNHCLQKNPSQRFQSANGVLMALKDLREESESSPSQMIGSGEPRTRGATARSLAVLPFRNLSDDQETMYLSDGITEELINSLGRIGEIKVVSRTSSFVFRDRAMPVQEIGAQLNVDSVLEGSVRASNGRVRVTVQLVDTAEGYQRWSDRYDREFEDVFEIQDEIARSIADVLKLRLAGAEAPGHNIRRTENLEAYRDYLLGRHCWNQETGESLQRALSYFEKALEKDPDYAPAHAGIADYFVMLAFWGLVKPADAWPEAREAALRALELDDRLAEAHVSIGLVQLFFDWNVHSAELSFHRALELHPNSPEARYARTLALTQAGRLTEALHEITQACECDPLSPILRSTRGWVHYYTRDYEDAIAWCERTLDLDSSFVEAHIGLGLSLHQTGDVDRAVQELNTARELSAGSPLVIGVLGAVLGAAGRTDEARALISDLDAIPDESYVPPMAYAMLYAGLGQKGAVFEHLRKALDVRDGLARYLDVLPIFDSVRDEPELKALIKELHLKP